MNSRSANQALLEDAPDVAGPVPFIYESSRSKSLHFDEWAVQSSMRKDAPFDLEVSYTQTMMGFLLLHPAPKEILIVGLGGGSLPKYCYHYLPDCRVTTVEINQAVIALRDEFAIPPDDARFCVVHADAAEYLAACPDSADVILLDGYDADGIPAALASQVFFDQCAQALRENGVLAANLCESDALLEVCHSRLCMAFDNRVMKARSETDCNKIVFALRREQMPHVRQLQDRAVALEAVHHINFQSMAAQMRASIRPDSPLAGGKWPAAGRDRSR